MKNDWLKKIEKILIVIFIFLGIVAAGGILWMLYQEKNETEDRPETEMETEELEKAEYSWEDGLSDRTLWIPDNCAEYEKFPEVYVTDADGKRQRLNDYFTRPTVVIFWAGWCEDCQQQMSHMTDFMEIAKEYGDVQFLFINKTDGAKETRESADTYFSELGIHAELFYDEGLEAYQTLGMHNIPTTFFIDQEGRLIDCSPSQITENGIFEAYLLNLVKGKSCATENFVLAELLDEEGGLHSTYAAGEKEKTQQSPVLSESQGLLLQYAAATENQELFRQITDYIKNHMLAEKGLTAWTVTEEESSPVNALLDDLRIYSAIVRAEEQWGGYEELRNDYQQRIYTYGIQKGQYVDFYDSSTKKKARRLTLCYIDLVTMKQLAAQEETFQNACDKAEKILAEGQISKEFPLYYSAYDYKSHRYLKDDLNMAEAMVTILHLAENGSLPEETAEWLRKSMAADGIKARYTVEGEAVEGYQYDSTAVYALVVQIADILEDDTLRDQALRKMEKLRINNAAAAYNGAFGMEDGTGITSFDQLLPLLTYEILEK